MMQKTLVILKPCTVIRGIMGEIISRFERKGLQFTAMKMMQLSDELLAEHYSHIVDKPFYPHIKDSMQMSPVLACCVEGIDAVRIVREMTGATNGRKAAVGTIRGDYAMSTENIVHTSDNEEHALVELARFFKDDEICEYKSPTLVAIYSADEDI